MSRSVADLGNFRGKLISPPEAPPHVSVFKHLPLSPLSIALGHFGRLAVLPRLHLGAINQATTKRMGRCHSHEVTGKTQKHPEYRCQSDEVAYIT